MKFPRITSDHQNTAVVLSIEGCNGAGKTTLLNRYKTEHPDTECILCVPEIYQTAKDMKHFMLFEASPLCHALYYLAGAIEMRARQEHKFSKILYDRSLWSTFAALYAKDESLLPDLISCLNSVRTKVFIPDHVVVLEASYATCQARSKRKNEGGEFDKDKEDEHNKKNQFYRVLEESGYPVTFINVDYLNAEDVYDKFIEVTSPLFSKSK